MMSSYLSTAGIVENPQTWESYVAIVIIIMIFIKGVLIKQLIKDFFVLMKQI